MKPNLDELVAEDRKQIAEGVTAFNSGPGHRTVVAVGNRWKTGDLLFVTGLSAQSFQANISRGAFEFEGNRNLGSGQDRKYSALDICVMALTKRLMDSGIAPSPAFRIANAARPFLAASEGPVAPGQPHHWLLILPEALWPAGRPSNMVRKDGYVAALVVDEPKNPDAPNGFLGTLRVLGGAGVSIDLAKFQNDLWSRLDSRAKTPARRGRPSHKL